MPLPKAHFSVILLVEDNLLHGEVWLESLDQRKGPVPDCLLTRSNTQEGLSNAQEGLSNTQT